VEIAIVYETLFGNTRRVAEAIAHGAADARPLALVSVMSTVEAGSETFASVDLLVVGGPTHAFRMSTAASRRQGVGQGEKCPTGSAVGPADAPGAREWLAALAPVGAGYRAAAFDTRLAFRLAGGAARTIARGLRHNGYELVCRPEGFIVDGAQGPLRTGENVRARAWGAELVRNESRRRIGPSRAA
jgi:hypothetical protein